MKHQKLPITSTDTIHQEKKKYICKFMSHSSDESKRILKIWAKEPEGFKSEFNDKEILSDKFK